MPSVSLCFDEFYSPEIVVATSRLELFFTKIINNDEASSFIWFSFSIILLDYPLLSYIIGFSLIARDNLIVQFIKEI